MIKNQKPKTKNRKLKLMTGNEACAEAAIRAGCKFYAGYPITPQNELTAYMARHMRRSGGVFIQAESELAAINMVFGASAAGARAMTSSSGPGISLKQEGISYLSACELPAVIVNVMRGGPGLGNIAPSQSDYFQATRGGGHGDYRTIVLAPANVSEFARFTYDAFGLADRYRMVVMVLADGILGQMMEPLALGHGQSNKVKKRPALNGCRNRKPRVVRSLLLQDGELEGLNKRLQQKYRKAEEEETRYEMLHEKDSQIYIIAYGTVSRIAKACVEGLRKKGVKIGLFRPITLWPFPSRAVARIASSAGGIFVIEMNEGQMLEDVKLAVEGRCQVHFYGRSGGGVPSEEEIINLLTKPASSLHPGAASTPLPASTPGV